MERRIREFIHQYKLIQPGENLIAGISGGADSVFLFYLLLDLKKQMGIDFTAVHIHHGIRGEEADGDQLFVEELCRSQGIGCRALRFSVPEIARREKLSSEEAGRMIRYRTFEAIRGELGADRIVLAHHENDCGETMLYNLARGSGLPGLCSLRPRRGHLIRPLLCVTREEIEISLTERGISWREDSTNREQIYTRNRIRNVILPEILAGINGGAIEHMANTARELEEIEDYLQNQTDDLWSRMVSEKEEGFLLSQELTQEPPILQRYVIRRSLELAAGSKRDLTRTHVQAVQSLFDKETGKVRHLPYQLRARREYRGVGIERSRDAKSGNSDTREIYNLNPQGENRIEDLIVHCCIRKIDDKRIPEKRYTKWIDYDRIKGTLVFRHRLPGDYIVINDRGGRKKLKDYFINEKIPREKRDGIWLVAVGSEILWIIGHRLSSEYKVRENTKSILRIEVEGGIQDGR